MKKLLYASLVTVAMSSSAVAQSWLTSGNTLTGTEKFGSTNNKSLDIVTNNTVRMKINNKGNVGIGITTLNINDRLSIKTTAPAPTATYTLTRGVFSEVTGNATSTYLNPTVAVYGKSTDNNGWGSGGHFEGDLYGAYGQGIYGFFGLGLGSAFAGDDFAIGVQGIADAADIPCYGVVGNSTSDIGTYNYGVTGYAGNSFFGNWAVMAVDELGGPGAAGYFDGDIEYTGSIFDVSDAQFKTNIQDLDNAMDLINQLHPKTYSLRTETFQGLNFGRENEMGFIAQEIKEVFPDLVKSCVSPVNPYKMGERPDQGEPFEYLAVNYMGLIPVLTKGIQEQQAVIDEQAKTIEALSATMTQVQAQLSQLQKQVNPGASMVIEPNSAWVGNASPNPANGSTKVDYYIPEQTKTAQLIIADMTGRQLSKTDISNKGNGSIEIATGALASGNYTYTLMADGVMIGTYQISVVR